MNRIAIILEVICKYFEIEPIFLFNKTRKREVTKCRFYFFYFAYNLTKRISYQRIGDYGKTIAITNRGWDHATVRHATLKVKDWIDYDPESREEVEILEEKILSKIKSIEEVNQLKKENEFKIHKRLLIGSIKKTESKKEILEILGEYIKSA